LEDDNQCEMNSVLHKELLTCVKRNCSLNSLYWTADQGNPNFVLFAHSALCRFVNHCKCPPDKEV